MVVDHMFSKVPGSTSPSDFSAAILIALERGSVASFRNAQSSSGDGKSPAHLSRYDISLNGGKDLGWQRWCWKPLLRDTTYSSAPLTLIRELYPFSTHRVPSRKSQKPIYKIAMAPSAVTPPAAPSTKTLQQNVEHNSGDPSLAFIHDETTAPPTFTDKFEERAYLKHRLALAFRIFAQFGFAEGVAGHITVRDPVDPSSFWVNPFGMHFSMIRDEDLIRVDHEGKVVDGGKNRRLNYGKRRAERGKRSQN